MSPTSHSTAGILLLGFALSLAGCGVPPAAQGPRPAPVARKQAPVRPAPYEGFKTFHYPSGVKKAEGRYAGGRKDGRWVYWHPDGRLRAEGAFRAGREHGAWTFWRPDGRKLSEGEFAAGKRVGLWRRFDDAGRMEIAQMSPPARIQPALGAVAVRQQDSASRSQAAVSTESEDVLEKDERAPKEFGCPLFPRAKLHWGMSGEEFFETIGKQFATYSEAPGGKAVFRDAEGDTMVVFGPENELDLISEVVRSEDRCQMLYNRLVRRYGKPNIQVAVGRSEKAGDNNPIVNATWWTDSTEIHFHHPSKQDAHRHLSTLAFRPVRD